MSTREWNNFFIDAGIPKNVAAQYAAVFNTNRMSFEMLMDLNKVSLLHKLTFLSKSNSITLGILERFGNHSPWRCHCHSQTCQNSAK